MCLKSDVSQSDKDLLNKPLDKCTDSGLEKIDVVEESEKFGNVGVLASSLGFDEFDGRVEKGEYFLELGRRFVNHEAAALDYPLRFISISEKGEESVDDI